MSQVPEETTGERVCAARDCEETFIPTKGKPGQQFHTKNCRHREGRHVKRGGLPEPDRGTLKAATAEQSIDAALAASRAADLAREHRAELKKLTAVEERMRRYLAVLQENLESFEPTPLVVVPNTDTSMPEQEHVLLAGDWHTGAKVQIHETGGMYEQTVGTTRAQVVMLWEKIKRLHAVQSSGSKITKLHLLGLGDLVDNDDMRPAQHRNVEDVVTVQTLHAFELWAWLIRQCLTLYEFVEVDMVGGNHDRTGRNRGNAGLGELDYVDTFSWLIGEMARRLLENEPRLKLTNWNTFFGYKAIAGQKVVFEHGSSFKWNTGGYGGVPWYAVSQLPRKYAEMLGPADLTFIGHGHRPAVLPAGHGWMFLNGALPGTTLYEQSGFKSIHRPLQTLLTVHAEHGVTSWQPIYLDVPGTVLPGEIWTDPSGYAERANQRPGLDYPALPPIGA